jgi:hypothetical protein
MTLLLLTFCCCYFAGLFTVVNVQALAPLGFEDAFGFRFGVA